MSRLVLSASAALLAVGTINATEYPGAIPGGFSVSDQGAGQYAIPIATPAATGGLRPNLALSYNHLAGNGLAGMRWTLSGFSSITRCQQTYAQDGNVNAIEYDASDRFCLDGQRLVVLNGDTYGANNSEYSTEIETFQRITSKGTAGSGPSYFVVEHGDGSFSHYGNSADSKIEKVGASDVRIWYITYTEDQFGNRITYGYDENTSTGEVLPETVDWTSNSGQGLSARYGVTISYATRPTADQRSGVDSDGAVWAITKRISSIDVDYNSTEIADYDLSYSTNSYTDRSQLDDVTLSRGTDTLPETVFTWQDGSEGWASATDTNKSAGTNSLIGDFNNDGNADIFAYLSGVWQVYPGTDAGNLGSAISSGQSTADLPDVRVLDVDGDGDSDLLYESGSYWYIRKSNGTSWASATNTNILRTTASHALIQDFDGDGLDDWVFVDGSGNVKWFRNDDGVFDTTAATLLTNTSGALGGQPNYMRPDFNGDGRDDLFYGTYSCMPPPIMTCTMTGYTALASGSSYTSLQSFATASGSNTIDDVRVADINGDGMTDVIYALSSTNTWYIRLSNGNSGLSSATNTGISSSGYSSSMVADYNNDGLDDLLRYSSGNYYVHLSDGSSWASSSTDSFAAEGSLVGDIDGDGLSELAYVHPSNGDWQIRSHNGDYPDYVTSFTNGLGYGIDVTYESMASTSTDHYRIDAADVPSSVHEQQFSGARYIVTHEDRDDGIGGTHNFSHIYDTAFIDRSGRGWLSFDHHIRLDLDNGTNVFKYLRQDWPFAGVVSNNFLIQTSPWQWIDRSQFTWEKTTTDTTTPDIHFIRIEETTNSSWEIGGLYDGDLVRTVVDDPEYNTTYGYLTERTITTSDPTGTYDWVTEIDYDSDTKQDTTNWCLFRPDLVQITKTLPDTTSTTRKIDHVWNTSDCSLTTTTDQSESSTAKQHKTFLYYDYYGNTNVVITDSVDGSAQDRYVSYNYDSWGHAVTKETIATVNLVSEQTWDYVNGQPASFKGPDGLTTTYDYDSFGRIAEVDTPTLDVDYSYNDCPCNVTSDGVYYVKAEGSDGSYEHTYFDSLDRQVGQAWPVVGAQARRVLEFDSLGQIDRVSQPYINGESQYWVDYEYDLIGRVTEQDAPVSESITSGAITTYDYLAETVKVTDAEGNITQRVHNPLGQVIEVIDDDSGTSEYVYTPFGQLTELTDAENNVTDIVYDDRGFKTSMDDPNMGEWSYAYNIYGELTSQTNALSQTTTLTYDQAGRPKTRVEPEGTTTWNYFTSGTGAIGKVSSITAPNSYQESYSYYTATGLPAEVRRYIDGTWYDIDLSYDSYGRLQYLEYPTSTTSYRFELKYEYDTVGNLKYVKDNNETYTYYTRSTTDALGRERSVSLGNGRTETRDYDDAAGYLKSIATDGSVQDLEFTYDEVGNVLTRSDDLIDETETFTYDDLNRLKTSQVTGESQVTLNYSAAGRITSKTGLGTYTYGAGSAGPFAVTSANGTSYTYDANGRMITRGGDDISWYSYDKPSEIENGTKTAEFWYGPDRSRYKQVQATSGTPDTTIRYVSALFEFEDPASGNDMYRHYVHAGSRVVAVVEREDTGSPSNTKKFLHRDNQGSVTKVTNASGSVIQSLAFDAWGLRRDPTDWSDLASPFAGSHETERGYTGHEHLDTVGLIHMNGRVQDPVLGRFISADPYVQAPFNHQSHNRYSYVWNNPASFIDPSGFGTCEHWITTTEDGATHTEVHGDWCWYITDEEWEEINGYFADRQAYLDSLNDSRDLESPFGRGGRAGTHQCNGQCHEGGIPPPEVSDETFARIEAVVGFGIENLVPGYGIYSCVADGCSVVGWGISVVTTIPLAKAGERVFGILSAAKRSDNVPLRPTQNAVSGPQVDRLAEDMRVNGFDPSSPVKVDGDLVVDGHHRVMAAREAGVDIVTTPGTATGAARANALDSFDDIEVDPVDWYE